MLRMWMLSGPMFIGEITGSVLSGRMSPSLAGKPAFITEYGAPAYGGASMSYEQAQQAQADYHKGNWLDILYNSAGYRRRCRKLRRWNGF